MRLTVGEYDIVQLLASSAGDTCRIGPFTTACTTEASSREPGINGYRVNVRSAVKRIRNKFRECDPAFDEIENFMAFGYR